MGRSAFGAVAVAAAMLLCATKAGAYTAGTPLPTTGAQNASGVAVNQSTRDVYVGLLGIPTQFEKGKLLRFNHEGGSISCSPNTPAPEYPGSVAVNPTNGDLYVLDNAGNKANTKMRVYGEAGCGAQKVSWPVETSAGKAVPGLATDSAGNVYVPNPQVGKVVKYSPSGEATVLVEGLTNPTAVAFDFAGHLFVASGVGSCTNNANGRLREFDLAGALPKLPGEGSEPIEGLTNVTTVAIDKSTGEAFVGRACGKTKGLAGGFRIEKYSSSGSKLAEFGGAESFGESAGTTTFNQLAIDEASGTVYATDSGNSQVQVFAPGAQIALTVGSLSSGGTGQAKCEVSGVLGACQAEYEAGTQITLKGVGDPGSAFLQWSSATGSAAPCLHASAPCTFTLAEASEAIAEFGTGGEKLTIVKEGSGEGTVTSSPAGIDCGATCEEFFEEGSSVLLSAAPALHSEFTEWEASDCDEVTLEGKCKVQMTGDRTVHLSFTHKTHELSVEAEGTGKVDGLSPSPVAGSISACEEAAGSCEATFDEADQVTLKATPAANHEVAWEGCGEVLGANGTECKLTLEADATVKAAFTLEKHQLTVLKEGGGQGTVTGGSALEPNTIDCGSAGSECEHEYEHGEAVLLTQEAENAKTEFKGWVGCDKVIGPKEEECEVAITSAKEVKARFAEGALFSLTVVKEGSGTGTVTSSPAGINCGSECSHEYEEEEEVDLSGSPGPHSAPVAWTGCDEVTKDSLFAKDNLCRVKMSNAKEVKASFNLISRTLTVTPVNAAGGSGTVSAASGAISGCKAGGGGTCSGPYAESSTVTLTATPALHSQVAWSGCTNATANACEVAMPAANASVSAVFTSKTHSLAFFTGSGTGSGHIECNGSPCIGSYPEGSVIELQAAPDPHSSFVGFASGTGSAAGCSGAGPCTIALEEDSSLSAPFARIEATLAAAPIGPGTVSASSGPISKCSEAGGVESVCSGTYEAGRKVILTADPAPHYQAQWEEGQCLSNPTPSECVVEVPDAGATVGVAFVPATHSLAIHIEGAGAGTVSCDGGACAAVYPEGVTISLKATPGPSSSFAGFSGGGCSGSSATCSIILEADTTVSARFDAAGAPVAPQQQPPPTTDEPKPKPTCKKGFKRRTVRGKARCVKAHGKRRHNRRGRV